MNQLARLGGFKVLKDVVQFSICSYEESLSLALELCRTFAFERINLPYLTWVGHDRFQTLDVVVNISDAARSSRLLEERADKSFLQKNGMAIVSIFPHKKSPEITGALLEMLGTERIVVEGMGNSPSALSTLLKEESVTPATHALFGPFEFSAYRTPADWKLAQKGKEELYREVVASYQEKHPKVYGLDYYPDQRIVDLEFADGDLKKAGSVFREFARHGLPLTFLVKGMAEAGQRNTMTFCLPASPDLSYEELIREKGGGLRVRSILPASVLSMNGPHFGDRYGIASPLLEAFEENRTGIFGLSCTVASVVLAVPADQLENALRNVQSCYEVPSVTKKM